MNLKKLKVEDIMVKELLTVAPEEKIALADLIMTRNSIGALPVVEKGKLVGIITQRDLMFAKNYNVGGLMVKDLMSKNLITVNANTSLKDALKLMLENKIERLPVLENGKLVGLLVHDRILQAIYKSI